MFDKFKIDLPYGFKIDSLLWKEIEPILNKIHWFDKECVKELRQIGIRGVFFGFTIYEDEELEHPCCEPIHDYEKYSDERIKRRKEREN